MLSLLGSTELRSGGGEGTPVDLGSRKPRSVLAALALRLGSEMSADSLVELVWGGATPGGAHGTLHAYISGLRRALEPDLQPRQPPSLLVTGDHGYRLDLPRTAVDTHAFADGVRAAHRRLSPLAGQLTGGWEHSWPGWDAVSEEVDRLEQLLGWWRGTPYADLPDHPEVAVERAALEELRRNAEEDRVLGLLALGDHATVVAATEQVTARDPLRERSWALHALALARSGRQGDALAALRRIRRLLADELGLDPGPELVELERLILVQDPRLHEHLAATVTPAAPAIDTAAAVAGPRDWSVVGREREQAALTGLLDRVADGEPGCALVVGEPGIGKSRLVERTAAVASARGYVVAVGRCSQDEGAPPLWPWISVLRSLADDGAAALAERLESRLAAGEGGDESVGFQLWDEVARTVSRRAEQARVLVVLDDLHWADAATLRVLSHLLTSTAPGERLAVIGTRRPWPEPTGPLAEVGESFARRHGLRLELTGLDREEAGALVAALRGAPPAESALALWHERSGGNPFFLIELARLGATGSFGAAGALPAGVRDVLLRRFGALPGETREVLVAASVLGRHFALDVLAAVLDEPPESVDDRLDPARAAGLVTDDRAGELSFSHALTRDAVEASVSPSRVGRLHTRIAHALENDPRVLGRLHEDERVAAAARHWLAAGPSYVGRAWRAACAAAEQARRAFSHEEAATLMEQAVAALRKDPAATVEELHQQLLVLAGDYQRAANWRGVVDASFQGIALARSAEDPARMARAAAELTRLSIWLPHEWCEVFEDVIDDLRWALARLPEHDSPERCALMLSLAVELYYDPAASAEVQALVDEGLAMARRLGDPRLTWWAARAGWLALWAPAYAEHRDELAAEALAAARSAHDEELEAVALCTAAASALELGDLDRYHAQASAAERIARRRRLFYVVLTLGCVELNLAAMRRDTAEVDARVAEYHALRSRVALPAEELQDVGIAVAATFWSPESLAPMVDPMLEVVDISPTVMGLDICYAALARVGRVDDLRRRMALRPVRYPLPCWSSVERACLIAESAAVVGDEKEARLCRDELAPLAGRMALAGIALALGPVDGYLALAEATLGNAEAAAAHADRAEELADAWGLPVYTEWLRQHRRRMSF